MSDFPLLLTLLWMALVGVVALLMMGVDKLLAKAGASRISERTFWFTSFFGGFWGIIVGATIFHHKTSKESFWMPVVVATALWVAALIYLVAR